MAEEKSKNMFDSLRLSAGGGLSSTLEKVAQAQNAATIAIGVGGTGLDAVRMFKKTVYERVKQDNFDKRDEEAPQYKRIKFLEIDSDDTHIMNAIPELDFSSDFEGIGVSNIVQELSDTEKIKSTSHLDWLNTEIDAKKIGAGAGGIRQVGKYLLSKKASRLRDVFRSMISSAITGLKAGFDLNIYIMAGIGGGTGSGCFIDVCYIMQQVLEDLGYGGTANVLGFFFLPDVNLSNPNFPKGGPHEIAVKENGYAALKELDYLMEIPRNGDVYEQKYNETFEVRLNKPPVTFCHLLSTKSINGAVIDDGYNYIMNVVAEYALNFVVQNQEAAKKGENSGITVKGIIANIDTLVAHTHKSNGAYYNYNILGTSCATVPYKEIGTYLAIKFFDSIKYIQKIRPNKNDVDRFCQNIGFSFGRIDVQVKSGTHALSLDASRFDTKALKAAKVGTIAAPLAEYCEKWKDSYEGTVTKNITTLGRELDSYDVNNSPESIIGKIYKELIAIANDPELGIYFAAYMLNDAQNYTLSSVLAGIRTEVENKRNHASEQMEYRNKCENEAQAEFRSAALDPFDKKKKNYVFMVEERYKNLVEYNTYDRYLGLIDKVKKHISNIESDYFKKMTRITDKLIKTFEDNAEHFNTFGMGNKMYTWSIVDIAGIQNQLDETVQNFVKKNESDMFVAPFLVEKFNKMLLENSDKWFDENNETKITELISRFICKEFKDEMSKSMLEFLREKYNCEGQNLINCISEKVINNGLVEKATPMFDMDPLIIDIDNRESHAEYIMLSLPNTEETFAEAAKKCRDDNDLNMGISQTVLTDRIFMLEFFSGIPMFAYRELANYEKVYYMQKTPGVHLNEGKNKNWHNLPSPIPATYTSMNYSRKEQAKVDEIIALYIEAKTLGVIKEDAINQKIAINVFENIDYGSILSKNWEKSKSSCKQVIDKLTEEKEMLEKNIHKVIELSSPYFEKTHIDNFVRMPHYISVVKDEVGKLKKLDEEIKNAQFIYEKINDQNETQSDFIRAILYSVITRVGQTYVFSYEKRGTVENVILTSGNNKYSEIPVYRAFVGYQQMDKEILEMISEKVAEAEEIIDPDVMKKTLENVLKYQEHYKTMYKTWKSTASSGDFENKEDIVKFLDEMYDSIDKFILNNQ